MNIKQKICVLAMLALLPVMVVMAREINSYALIADDATLTISNKQIRLYGVHIPATQRTCQTAIRPVRCAPGAALALDFKIQGFVRCELLTKHRGNSYTGRCFYKDEDLSAYLVSQGWALALPESPQEYKAFERIARHHRLGIWNVPNANAGGYD